jgi:type II secretory pathway pseudopilin PulG
MKNLLARSTEAKARFDSIKERGGVIAVLKTEGGAIDLASIMVGVLVIGIIGGVIAATVFAVVPFAQDEAAKGALDSVKQAQSVAFALNSADGAGSFETYEDLTTATGDSALLQTSDSLAIVTDGVTYTAYVESDSGQVFSITNADPNTAVPVDGSVAGNAYTP